MEATDPHLEIPSVQVSPPINDCVASNASYVDHNTHVHCEAETHDNGGIALLILRLNFKGKGRLH